MKKLHTILLFSLSMVMINANDTEQVFQDANSKYHSEAYSEAAELYESLVAEGLYSDELFYNLGNSYYQLNEVALAIYNYERALLLSPGDEDITFNLTLAQLRLQDKIETVPPFILNVWFQSLVNSLNSNTWVLLAILSIVLAFVGLLVFIVGSSTRFKQMGLTVGVVFLGISILFTVFSAKRYTYIFKNNYAIIGAPTSIVKGSPSENATDIVILHEGTKVEELNSYQNHIEIKLPDGNIGWVPSDDLLPVRLSMNK